MTDKDHRKVASHVLYTANKAVSVDRGPQHGPLEDSFEYIAQLWTTYIEGSIHNRHERQVNIDAFDVLQMMTLLKIGRAVYGDASMADHYADAAGYQSLAAAIAGVQVPTPPQAGSSLLDMERKSVAAMAKALAPKSEGGSNE